MSLAMSWAPQSVRSCLIEYLMDIESSVHLTSQTGVMPATGSVLAHAGYSSSASNMQVGQPPSGVLYCMSTSCCIARSAFLSFWTSLDAHWFLRKIYRFTG